MSASYVRETAYQWAAETAARVGINFYETINYDPAPTDAIWWTLAFDALNFSGTFCAADYVENGDILVIICAPPGTGCLDAIRALEMIGADFWEHIDPTKKLGFTSDPLPIYEDSAGAADKTYRVGLSFSYGYSKN